jgi:hypothetical protein
MRCYLHRQSVKSECDTLTCVTRRVSEFVQVQMMWLSIRCKDTVLEHMFTCMALSPLALSLYADELSNNGYSLRHGPRRIGPVRA